MLRRGGADKFSISTADEAELPRRDQIIKRCPACRRSRGAMLFHLASCRTLTRW